MKFVVLALSLLLSHVHGLDFRIDPLVLTRQGLVRGQRATDGDYTTFLGIPYAIVDEDNPFGNWSQLHLTEDHSKITLPFGGVVFLFASQIPGRAPWAKDWAQPAKPHTAFEELIFRANDGSTKCPQSNIAPLGRAADTQTLNCLKLNIYVPNEATSYNPLPVLVWIHGGVFGFGSAGENDVTKLVKQGIVVVTINYRLGPYGFMCLDVPAVPGNQGLKDQHTALRWIRNNIAAFGGNPYNVTLAGHSAGAGSVLLHLYSPKEKLFQKIIVQSGTPQSEGMFINGDAEAAIKLSRYLNFNTTDTEEALAFLANVPHNSLTSAMLALDSVLQLRPCKERSFSGVEIFVEDDPYTVSNERKIRNTPILIGHTSKEEMNSAVYRPNYYDTDIFYEKIAKNYNLNQETLAKVSNTVKHYYIGDKDISVDVTSQLEDFESDFIFNHPTQRVITKLLSEQANPVYQYMFSYVGDSGAEGATHSAELKYLFGNSNLSEEDQFISDSMVAMWANFVKHGNPTPNDASLIQWTPITSESRPYLVIDTDLRMESRVFKERMAFWDLFHDNYGSSNILARECRI